MKTIEDEHQTLKKDHCHWKEDCLRTKDIQGQHNSRLLELEKTETISKQPVFDIPIINHCFTGRAKFFNVLIDQLKRSQKMITISGL